MSEINLVCNYKKCRMDLKNTAWVTRCSHIFCDSDGSHIFHQEKKCPCCNAILNRRLDIVQTNLNPDESLKSMILSGLRPEIVMDISTRALLFWNSQMTREKTMHEATIKQLQQKLAQVKIHVHDMEQNFQKNLSIESKKTESALKDAQLQRQKTQEAEERLMEKNRILLQVQSKNESLEHQLDCISNTIKSGKKERIPTAQLRLKPLKGQTEFIFAPHYN